MTYALMSSGGKDSTLALHRATEQGLDVRFLVNIFEGSTGRVRFHGVHQTVIACQARGLGLELVAEHTTPDDFETVFLGALDRLREHGATGVVFGNIHLADVRAWYEERVRQAGFEHIEPLWQEPPDRLVEEFVDLGYRAIVVSVDLDQGACDLLGRTFDASLLADLRSIEGLDPCGERGEYHSYVFDGPRFLDPVRIVAGREVEIEGHRFLDLELSTR